jgi:VCBS repeat-containing protein
VTVSVTAENGDPASYVVTVRVAASSDVGLSSLLVNGANVLGSLVYKTGFGVDQVVVTAVTSDVDATYSVSGVSGLVSGSNLVTVRVLAADGFTAKSYVVVVTVPSFAADNTLKLFQVDGVDVHSGDVVDVLSGVSSVPVVAVANSENASVVVSGGSGLHVGLNVVTVAVTAENGDPASYVVTVRVAASSDVGLSSLLVNGANVLESLVYKTGFGVDQVVVTAVTSDVDATYSVSGVSGLVSGSNLVTVRVLAADGFTAKSYVVVVTVPSFAADNTLKLFQVDGVDVHSGDVVDVLSGVSSVPVVAVANSENASVVVSGGSGLHVGLNVVTVSVTAENGDPASYVVTVRVAASGDSGLESILVNGSVVAVGGTFDVAAGTQSVTVVGRTSDAEASFEVTGNESLVEGDNLITITVTAADSTPTRYTFKVYVQPFSDNAELSVFSINGFVLADGDTIEVQSDVVEAAVVAIPEFPNATYEVITGTALEVGKNIVSVRVTSESGRVAKVYSATVNRQTPASSNVNISQVFIDQTPIEVGGTYFAEPATTQVVVDVVTEDAKAGFRVLGNTALKTGLNTIRVLVTAENGDADTYLFYVDVSKPRNTNLSSLRVDGISLDLENDLEYSVSSKTESVTVLAVAEDLDATVTVSGSDQLSAGKNYVTVTVLAADGVTTKDYVIALTKAELSGDNRLSSIKVDGTSIEVDGQYDVEPGITSVNVVATAFDSEALVEILGNEDLNPGANTVTVTVTAQNGDSAEYLFIVFVKSLSGDTSLSTLKVNGADAEEGSVIHLDGSRNFVSIVAKTTDVNASLRTIETTKHTSSNREQTMMVSKVWNSSRRRKKCAFISKSS